MNVEEALRLATVTDYTPTPSEQAEASAVLAAEIQRLRGELDYIANLTGCRCKCEDCPECVARRALGENYAEQD